MRDTIVWRLGDAGRAAIAAGARLGRRQQALVALLGTEGASAAAIAEAGHQAVVRDFAKRGWLESEARPEAPPPAGLGRPWAGADGGPACAAVARIGASLAKFEAFLLHGVTGSGKTEVYLRPGSVRSQGKGSLVLVPEIALTPQLVGRFRSRFGAEVAVLHSALKDRERLFHWQALRHGTASIAVGVRSAVVRPGGQPGPHRRGRGARPLLKQEEKLRYTVVTWRWCARSARAHWWCWARPRPRWRRWRTPPAAAT